MIKVSIDVTGVLRKSTKFNPGDTVRTWALRPGDKTNMVTLWNFFLRLFLSFLLRIKETEIALHSTISFLKCPPTITGSVPGQAVKLRARNSPRDDRDPRTWAINCCFPGCILAGKWNWKQNWESNPGNPTCYGSDLIAASNVGPSLCNSPRCGERWGVLWSGHPDISGAMLQV